jgi:hypothetical protein
MKWVTNYASLFSDPATVNRLLYLTVGQLVDPTGGTLTVNGNLYLEVNYSMPDRSLKGWVYSGYLEELVNEFPQGAVPTTTQTPTPNDAAQDIVFLGNVQYNLCGEFCVAFIAGDTIDHFLSQWQPRSPSVFSRIFLGGRSRPTGAGDVLDMLSVYGLTGQDLAGLLADRIKNGLLLTPGRVAAISADHHIILGVNIDKFTGSLRGSGVGHWVCVEKVVPDGIGRGWVEFYNPFVNQIQRESWATVAASMGTQPYGLAVPRQRQVANSPTL